jgi:hypothetical protein
VTAGAGEQVGDDAFALDDGAEVLADVVGVDVLDQGSASRLHRGHRHGVGLGAHRRRHRHIITHRGGTRQIRGGAAG